MIVIFEYALKKFLCHANIKHENPIINISFSNSLENEIRKIQTIGTSDFNKLATIKGVIIDYSNLIPNITSGFFKCEICCLETYSYPDNGLLSEPVYCFNCKNFQCFRLLYYRSNFSNKQYILVQDLSGTMDSETLPDRLIIVVHGDSWDKFKKGDYIIGTGIIRASPIWNTKKTSQFPFIKIFLDILYIEKTSTKKNKKPFYQDLQYFKTESSHLIEKNEQKRMFNSLGQNPKVLKILKTSLVPDIIGFEVIKLGILAQLMDNFNEKNRFCLPQKLNILLLGENSLFKYKILKFVSNLIPKSIFLNGKNSISKKFILSIDSENNLDTKRVIRGPLFQADGGTCCIDEIQDLPAYLFPVLKEIANQQSISIARDGIVRCLPAKISFLSSLNKETWKTRNNTEHLWLLDLPESFFKSFDLLYCLNDLYSGFIDKKLAEYTVELILQKEDSLNKKKGCLPTGLGFTSKSFAFFIRESSKIEKAKNSEMALKEVVKWVTILERIKNTTPIEILEKNRPTSYLIEILSQTSANLRFSEIVGIEDIRDALVNSLEASKSLESFFKVSLNSNETG
mmetsp:Transcript_14835/g.29764  ORF Transcript_14835/g.29764 Transcript_14835/m.29764 type:complete len:569 (+) Transcript_14835:346-2052(+)